MNTNTGKCKLKHNLCLWI